MHRRKKQQKNSEKYINHTVLITNKSHWTQDKQAQDLFKWQPPNKSLVSQKNQIFLTQELRNKMRWALWQKNKNKK